MMINNHRPAMDSNKMIHSGLSSFCGPPSYLVTVRATSVPTYSYVHIFTYDRTYLQ